VNCNYSRVVFCGIDLIPAHARNLFLEVFFFFFLAARLIIYGLPQKKSLFLFIKT
jgi:hypothetical protein